MPKCYSDEEKEYIVRRLKEEAAKCLAQYGIRHTTVDELVRRVKIPKGTFYLFYKSKELLLFDVILEIHNKIEEELYKSISSIDASTFTEDKLTDIIFGFFKLANEMPILNIINSDDVELLARKLPAGVLEEHLGHDNSMIERVFETLPLTEGVDSEIFSAAFRAIYFSTLHREEIGGKSYDGALRLLIKGVVAQMFAK